MKATVTMEKERKQQNPRDYKTDAQNRELPWALLLLEDRIKLQNGTRQAKLVTYWAPRNKQIVLRVTNILVARNAEKK